MSEPIPEEKIAELSDLLFRGNKIGAIKLYRELTGFGLKESKESVDALEASLRKEVPEKFSAAAAQQKKGCLGATTAFCLCIGIVFYWAMRA